MSVVGDRQSAVDGLKVAAMVTSASRIYFHAVCVTTVILAPGSCGMGVPSRSSRHHYAGSGGSRCKLPKTEILLLYASLQSSGPPAALL